MKFNPIGVISVFLALSEAWVVFAQSAPPLINYQGQLQDSQGAPFPTADYVLTFSIWDASTGGNRVWGPQVFDGQTGAGHGLKIPVVQGYFNVMLGPVDTTGRSLDGAFEQSQRFVEISVAGQAISPRQRILSAPYAVKALSADAAGYAAVAARATNAITADNAGKLAGYDWTNLFGTNNPTGKIDGSKLVNITSNQIAPATITSAQIAPNTITSNQIAVAGITSLNIADGTVGAQHLASGSIGPPQIAPNAIQTDNITNGAITFSKLASRQTGTNSVGVGGVVISSAVTGTEIFPNQLKVTLVTAGRPVFVGLVGDAQEQTHALRSSNEIHVRFLRNGKLISRITSGAAAPYWPPSAFWALDVEVEKGTNTYNVDFKPSADIQAWGVRLVAFEL